MLGVSAINYSLLLPRSSDFATYEAVMKPAYPSELDRLLGLSAIQLEWDRAEPDGYANHMTTDPLPNTPAPLEFRHADRQIVLPASAIPFVVTLLIVALRYTFGYLYGRWPELRADPLDAAILVGAGAFLAGLNLGRISRIAWLYHRRRPAVASIA